MGKRVSRESTYYEWIVCTEVESRLDDVLFPRSVCGTAKSKRERVPLGSWEFFSYFEQRSVHEEIFATLVRLIVSSAVSLNY